MTIKIKVKLASSIKNLFNSGKAFLGANVLLLALEYQCINKIIQKVLRY